MSKKIGIYRITNLSNNKVYIGKSTSINYRWRKHLWFLKRNKHVNKHLQSAFNKYGENQFTFEIIEECSSEELNDKEKYWINLLDSLNPLIGYNKTKGGDGLLATDEIKKKISKSLTGIKHSQERIENQSKSHRGKSLSNETKIKQSNSQKIRFQDDNEIIKHRLSMSKNPIIQLDLNGNFITEFISIREAERITKIHSSTISRVCKNERKSAGNYLWKYKKDYDKNLNNDNSIGQENGKLQIQQLSLKGELVKTWNSISLAAKETGSSKSSIIRCCKNKQKTCNNFIWKYLNN